MYVPFNQLPPESRIWIYQADREFTAAETEKIEEEIQAFVTQWAAHGKQLKASGALLHNRFLILGADESAEKPSGCSIDSSVQFIRGIEAAYKVSFFDRTRLAFMQDNAVFTLPLQEIKQAVTEGKILPQTPYFNNLITQANQLNNQWLQPANESWLIKYF